MLQGPGQPSHSLPTVTPPSPHLRPSLSSQQLGCRILPSGPAVHSSPLPATSPSQHKFKTGFLREDQPGDVAIITPSEKNSLPQRFCNFLRPQTPPAGSSPVPLTPQSRTCGLLQAAPPWGLTERPLIQRLEMPPPHLHVSHSLPPWGKRASFKSHSTWLSFSPANEL